MLSDNTAIFNDLSRQAMGQEQGRVSVFIDAAHVFYAASTLGIEIDYSKLVAQLVRRGRLLRAYFYTGVDSKNTKQQGFLLWMKRNGYRVITKEIANKESADATQRSIDFCVEITTDMIEQSAFCDTVILVTGDGRFSRLLNHFAHSRTRTELVSLQSITSERLLSEADSATDFVEIQDAIAKRHISHKRARFNVA
ncbi:NYN domain-containing protein [Leptolyngbya cf. ectocarpi LEGE 11479]|uniref:NYN domain-containing protein n=1 Tax=Leptolyngbya cf. ectocarpi LEGE 11479 TaxID=1828722 RepID=A0A928ZSZ7_LEPEC|nr:NYN domain-containing protein [Leptolyngbya ectocarpi]MBE9067107.1 NYN domain-containing protein [Leptolyngbya cf. ectocarpi LEGE 11479]